MAQATTKDWLDGIQKGLLKQLTENRVHFPRVLTRTDLS